jgi:two-component sensor histidine kinase
VHQQLHQRADVTHIDVREYVHDLLQTIFSFFTGKEVTIENEAEARSAETLGLQLLSGLVNQIRGSLELERSRHPVYSIRFPMPKT